MSNATKMVSDFKSSLQAFVAASSKEQSYAYTTGYLQSFLESTFNELSGPAKKRVLDNMQFAQQQAETRLEKTLTEQRRLLAENRVFSRV